MATTAEVLADPGLLNTAWDLSPLIDGDLAHGFDNLLAEAATRATTFAEEYTGKVGSLDAAALVVSMQELAAISEIAGKAGNYASLNFSTDTADPARGALLQKMQEKLTQVETTLLFFDLEWADVDDAQADALLDTAGEDLAFAAHHLRATRRYRPHLLSEPEEKLMAEKSLTSSNAWSRLFGELVSALRVTIEGEEKSFEIGMSMLQDTDRETRRTAAEAVTAALAPGLRTRAFIFNTLLFDKSVDDRLRKYPHWIASRNLSNEASDESVEALISAVTRRYDIPQRWYRLKAKLIGVPQLADYDRNAPISAEGAVYSYQESVDLVREAYSEFSPVAGETVGRFFDEGWIDAPVRDHKRGGAFCAYTVPSVHPYVMLNFTAKRRDVLTMAHELGHGLHAALAQPRGVFHQSTPLTLAETASTFGESLVFEKLLAAAPSDRDRLDLLADRIDDAIATVFRQVAMNRFENVIHNQRREQGELAADDFSAAWFETQSDLMGDSLEITEGYKTWWSYIPHFINSPGYVYAYAYGQLLALSAYGRFKEVGPDFVPSYMDLLASGGSKSPEELGQIIGIDLADPGFWDAGLRLVDAQLKDAEDLVETIGI